MPSLLFFYWVSFLLSPFVRLIVHQRVRLGLEDPSRIQERFGRPVSRPEDTLLSPLESFQGNGPIWFHAASVGETVSLISLIQKYKELYPLRPLLLTTTTLTAGKIANQRLKGVCFHRYAPLDVGPWIKRFLEHWNPCVVVLVESELWPTLIEQVHGRKIPLILLNARLSSKSYRRWKRVRLLAKGIILKISLCGVPSEKMAKRLRTLGAKNLSLSPNLKFSATPLPVSQEKLQAFQKILEGRPCWVAASTHAGEEIHILEAHKILKKDFPGLLTIIIPRHPARIPEVATLCQGLSFARHSEFPKDMAKAEILLGDSMGELGLFFSLSPIVFIGGSLVPTGGHNPIEPALLKCAVLWGPFIENVSDICDVLSPSCYPLSTKYDLVPTVRRLLLNPDQARKSGEEAAEKVKQQEGRALTCALQSLERYVNAHP